MPTTLREKLTPIYFKKGDIFKRCGLDHPYVLWEEVEHNKWIAILITSKDNDNTSEKVEGRYENTYYSYTLTMITNPLMSDYCGNIENIEQLNKVVEKLLTMFLKPYKNKQSKSRLSWNISDRYKQNTSWTYKIK